MEEMHIAEFLVVIETAILAYVTWLLYKATELHPATSVMAGFQNEWHSEMAGKMRRYLHSQKFKDEFNEAIRKAYGSKTIKYTEIHSLLKHEKPGENSLPKNGYEGFRQHLKAQHHKDPITGNELFTAYDALEHVLLTFDRLAVFQNRPVIMKTFIEKYKPPMRDLEEVLQGFIAVENRLGPRKGPYKKDYVLLLRKLCLADDELFRWVVKEQAPHSKVIMIWSSKNGHPVKQL